MTTTSNAGHQDMKEQEEVETRVDGSTQPGEQRATAASHETNRALLENAFREGYAEGFGRNQVFEVSEAWERSATKKALPGPPQ